MEKDGERLPITVEGFQKLQEELKRLKNVERHKIVLEIAEARKLGDLSENAEYHAARERQSFIEGRVIELEDKISRCDVIDVSKLSGDRVTFGAFVALLDEDTEEKVTYQIVGEDEADIKGGKLSVSSPLARSLVGKEAGEVFELLMPRGNKSYKILGVSYVHA